MKKLMLATATIVAFSCGAVANAALTPINTPWAPATSNSNELNLIGQDGILDRLANDASLSYFGLNGASYTRVDDNMDQIWKALQDQSMTASAIFAGAENAGGYLMGTSGGSFTALTAAIADDGFIDQADLQEDVLGLTPGTLFRWAISTTLGPVKTSLPSDNPLIGGRHDLMVTFKIDGVQGLENAYVIAFEDGRTDFDYNDFVAVVKGVQPVPAPGAALLGFLGMGIAGWWKRKTA